VWTNEYVVKIYFMIVLIKLIGIVMNIL
jgi:hypothetical protein